MGVAKVAAKVAANGVAGVASGEVERGAGSESSSAQHRNAIS